ncbi:uncharacterized protein LOC124433845 isoform X4 [Xenia sp. Carnegie-2017]|uniref:uncharacterized protein LOC124433845 isoform X4 n=1 Tax=Xenia sp. Carnegie-2017 TaxID=2897299 RepID=UPI001F0496FC|nr:uncharacterized protein LOC124433845 isoform X4 [Xenia sp. Carnegie-2017]
MKGLYFVALILGVLGKLQSSKIKVVKGYNPGPCLKNKSGEITLVRDRQNEPKLLICLKVNGIFGWRTIDGSSSPGEFFNPVYDCSTILDKDPKAKDGFYWITLGEKKPKRIYCDMTTDGGGFMLIGRKNTSVTWTVPSNSKTVEPFGEPHWISSLGEAPMVDFRVQMATRDDFKTTKAHWFYRFQNPRKLKNLMIYNKGGCTKTSPGIGDVKFVKDLMTENIVTTSFRCSKFGLAYNKRAQFGWAKMNNCLCKPCPLGFAFHHKYPLQTDFSGAFSYSTTNAISGMEFGATALVGCDSTKCCGCYGPKNGKNDYCFKECEAKNGGTIKKNVYAWFWVRSRIPRRIWRNCMDYKVIENGNAVWYKLLGSNGVPVKGRCTKDKPLFYDGMIVVPDNNSLKKVPNIEGMMVYRKDKNKLYVQEDKQLKALAEEKKILQTLNKDISKLQNEINTINATLGRRFISLLSYDISASKILRREPERFLKQLKTWFSFDKLTCCWRASIDGWNSRIFHSRCDFRGKTITLVKVGRYIFGGYSTISWGGSSGYRSSSSTYLFSLRNKDNLSPFRSPVYRYSSSAIHTKPSIGPTFGAGHDLYIANNANKNQNSRTDFGDTYRAPSGYSYGSSNTKLFLQVHATLHLMKLKFITMFSISREFHVIFIMINSTMYDVMFE